MSADIALFTQFCCDKYEYFTQDGNLTVFARFSGVCAREYLKSCG